MNHQVTNYILSKWKSLISNNFEAHILAFLLYWIAILWNVNNQWLETLLFGNNIKWAIFAAITHWSSLGDVDIFPKSNNCENIFTWRLFILPVRYSNSEKIGVNCFCQQKNVATQKYCNKNTFFRKLGVLLNKTFTVGASHESWRTQFSSDCFWQILETTVMVHFCRFGQILIFGPCLTVICSIGQFWMCFCIIWLNPGLYWLTKKIIRLQIYLYKSFLAIASSKALWAWL